MPTDKQREIAKYLNWPTAERWNAIRQMIILPAKSGQIRTLWQLVIAANPEFIMARIPGVQGQADEWSFIPDAILLARVIKRHLGA